jgi:hypothetical protein
MFDMKTYTRWFNKNPFESSTESDSNFQASDNLNSRSGLEPAAVSMRWVSTYKEKLRSPF